MMNQLICPVTLVNRLGWDPVEWDEDITDLQRILPAGTNVIKCKVGRQSKK